VGSGHHGQSTVTGALVSQLELHDRETAEHLAELSVIGQRKALPVDLTAVQIVAGAALVHHHQTRRGDLIR
jgi:hypothetical protein